MFVERPSTAYALSIIGGVFILVGGISIILFGTVFGVPFIGFSLMAILGSAGLVMGVLVISGGVLAYEKPRSRSFWGGVILVACVLSLPTSGGGFIIGFVFALTGGILYITWKPSAYSYYGYRTCWQCGQWIPANNLVCPYCGLRPWSPGMHPDAATFQYSPHQQMRGHGSWYEPSYANSRCPSCQEALPRLVINFCPKCGTRVLR